MKTAHSATQEADSIDAVDQADEPSEKEKLPMQNDPTISQWPEPSHHRSVVKATTEPVGRGLYRIVFQDSADKQMVIQLPREALQSVVNSGAEILGG